MGKVIYSKKGGLGIILETGENEDDYFISKSFVINGTTLNQGDMTTLYDMFNSPDLETIQSFMHHWGDEELMQFTGLKDAKGKEIYEGDILYYRYKDKEEESGYGEIYYEVVFEDGAFGFMGDSTGELLPFWLYPITDEIMVGNIHENPELLKNDQ